MNEETWGSPSSGEERWQVQRLMKSILISAFYASCVVMIAFATSLGVTALVYFAGRVGQ
jgi:hypothetical protein